MDRRWQLVLDCLDVEHAPFSKGTLVTFREPLIAHDLDRRLIERTVDLAAETKAMGSRQLRAALDSSPLWGAGRVEDTYDLLGHALRNALGVIARQQGRGLTDLADETGVPLLDGTQSLKAALDCNWVDPAARTGALSQGAGDTVPRRRSTKIGRLRCQTRPEQRSRSQNRCGTRILKHDDLTTWSNSGVGSPKSPGSVWTTARCGMDGTAGATDSTAISGTSCATSTQVSCGQLGSRRRMRPKPV